MFVHLWLRICVHMCVCLCLSIRDSACLSFCPSAYLHACLYIICKFRAYILLIHKLAHFQPTHIHPTTPPSMPYNCLLISSLISSFYLSVCLLSVVFLILPSRLLPVLIIILFVYRLPLSQFTLNILATESNHNPDYIENTHSTHD